MRAARTVALKVTSKAVLMVDLLADHLVDLMVFLRAEHSAAQLAPSSAQMKVFLRADPMAHKKVVQRVNYLVDL